LAHDQFLAATIADNAIQCAGRSGTAQCIGFTGEGLPLSMQIVGRPFDDATVLRVAHAYEGATPWRASRPLLDPNTTVANTLPPVPEPAQPEITAARRNRGHPPPGRTDAERATVPATLRNSALRRGDGRASKARSRIL
jgi:hypothetical protein